MAKNGQVMILSVLALGGTILGATTIAGLLMVYQLRATSDVANSAKAIFAADSGIDWMLYQVSQKTFLSSDTKFSNGAKVTAVCYDSSQPPKSVQCSDKSVKILRSIGQSGSSYRALEMNL